MNRYLISLILAALITLLNCLTPGKAWAIAFPPSPIAALPLVNQLFKGTSPQNLGIHEGKLTSCPSTPNCVVSQDADSDHAIAPIPYHTDRNTAKQLLIKVLGVVPRTTIIEETEDYIRVESASRLMGFIDDGEFYFPPDEKVIHIRSASRLGESDLGVNRRRLEQIRLALKDLGV
ncbi:protein of unknown function DUF1499 [Gloeothece citriformis PCC 7424]|uniref:DUF1499 domain-containing protein n=1 Tax=Gloeothece citriformis (strain PCC 7424) TaxID=65393 RepID=B7K8H3_GLOC7|nr:DUF1499 domain-containing protein [Gloeothece citriformis]ACK69933.1 protein of unknown function DUF1499 [Gloeothece citriformis PCC 7424]